MRSSGTQSFDYYYWPESLRNSQCSGKMERCIMHTELNHIYMEHPMQVTYTAAPFYLFHNGRVISELPWSYSLHFQGNERFIDLSVVVPKWQVNFGSTVGAILILVALLRFIYKVHRFTNELAEKLRRPQVLVRALADAAAFPTQYFELFVVSFDAKDPKNPDKQPEIRFTSLRDVPVQSIELGPVEERFSNSPNSMIVVRKDDILKK